MKNINRTKINQVFYMILVFIVMFLYPPREIQAESILDVVVDKKHKTFIKIDKMKYYIGEKVNITDCQGRPVPYTDLPESCRVDIEYVYNAKSQRELAHLKILNQVYLRSVSDYNEFPVTTKINKNNKGGAKKGSGSSSAVLVPYVLPDASEQVPEGGKEPEVANSQNSDTPGEEISGEPAIQNGVDEKPENAGNSEKEKKVKTQSSIVNFLKDIIN